MTIIVTNNADGTYTVECGGEKTSVGSPHGAGRFPGLSHSGGNVSCHIIDLGGRYTRGQRVNDEDEIVRHVNAYATRRGTIGTTSRVLEFSLVGQHSIDVGKIHAAFERRQPNLTAPEVRIFVGASDE
jgi:hypothetical protein